MLKPTGVTPSSWGLTAEKWWINIRVGDIPREYKVGYRIRSRTTSADDPDVNERVRNSHPGEWDQYVDVGSVEALSEGDAIRFFSAGCLDEPGIQWHATRIPDWCECGHSQRVHDNVLCAIPGMEGPIPISFRGSGGCSECVCDGFRSDDPRSVRCRSNA